MSFNAFMSNQRTTRIAKVLAAAVFSALLLLALPSRALAQDEDNDVNPDAPGCKDSALLGRINATKLLACDHDHDGTATVPVGLDSNGSIVEKNIRGDFAKWVYAPVDPSSASVYADFKDTLDRLGFTIVFQHDPDLITARKDNVWCTLDNSGDQFKQVIVDGQEQPDSDDSAQAAAAAANVNAATGAARLAASAEKKSTFTLADRLNMGQNVPVMDIKFDGATATMLTSSNHPLEVIAEMLKKNPTLKLRMVSYTDEIGWSEGNEVLAARRAEAVTTWLTNHGIESARLSHQGLGAPPVTDPKDASGPKNRIELSKVSD
jgi:outer membrane protein OmpA-like peptidoglycan-associated protein